MNQDKLDRLNKVCQMFPEFQLEMDSLGQFVFYTNIYEDDVREMSNG